MCSERCKMNSAVHLDLRVAWKHSMFPPGSRLHQALMFCILLHFSRAGQQSQQRESVANQTVAKALEASFAAYNKPKPGVLRVDPGPGPHPGTEMFAFRGSSDLEVTRSPRAYACAL